MGRVIQDFAYAGVKGGDGPKRFYHAGGLTYVGRACFYRDAQRGSLSDNGFG